MQKKILLITQVFYPDEVSTANLFTNLCSVLVEDNVEVEVWCAQPSYTHLEKQPKKIVRNGIKILFLSSTNFQKTSLSGRILNYLTFAISVIFKLLLYKEKNTILSHTTPPTLGIILSYICSFKRLKFVYILMDIFPEGLIRLGKVSKNNIVIKLWQKLFIASLKKCTKIVVIGRDMQQWISDNYSGLLNKTEYIPLWQDDTLIFPMEYFSNDFVIEYSLQEKFVVQYSGNMGLWNDMATLGNVVNKNIEDVLFMFVGGGMRKNELLNTISLQDKKNIISLPFQPKEKLKNILTACHIGVVSLRKGLEGMAVPSKIYGIMAAGIPVIALVPLNSEIAYIVQEENCGYVLDPTDMDGLINAIALLKSDGNLRNQMGHNSRIAFMNKYTTKKIAAKYKAMVRELD